jgi:predicted Na+-dependent transporter
MNWSTMMRQSHRWLSLFFTLTVIANFIALFMGQSLAWLTYLPLLPLALMLLSGLYLFFLPYAQRRRAGRRAAG